MESVPIEDAGARSLARSWSSILASVVAAGHVWRVFSALEAVAWSWVAMSKAALTTPESRRIIAGILSTSATSSKSMAFTPSDIKRRASLEDAPLKVTVMIDAG